MRLVPHWVNYLIIQSREVISIYDCVVNSNGKGGRGVWYIHVVVGRWVYNVCT